MNATPGGCPCGSIRPSGRIPSPWKYAGTIGVALFLMVFLVAGPTPSRLKAQHEGARDDGGIVKIGKTYINLSTLTYIVDDPGNNLPPGTMQLNFASAGQNYLYLYGEQAEAFRQHLSKHGSEPSAGVPSGSSKAVPTRTSTPRRSATPKKAPPPPPPINDPGE